MKRRLLIVIATALAGIASPTLAHHPLAGAPMETFTHGVLSGVGHPILGFDHLFFVVALGIAAYFTGKRLVAPVFYLAGMVGGVALVMNGIPLPMTEMVIALSLVAVGGVVLAGKALSLQQAGVLFAAAGLFHGWAFGGSIAGQEAINPTVTAGYLIGLSVTQWIIAVVSGYLATGFWRSATSKEIQPRLAGAVAAGVGATFFLEGVESAAYAAMGLG